MIRLAIAFALAATPLWATADGPEFWQVKGVRPDDVLNMRMGPGTEYMILDTLPHNARRIRAIVCVPTLDDGDFFALTEAEQTQLNTLSRWCYVQTEDLKDGWVNMRFMEEDAGP